MFIHDLFPSSWNTTIMVQTYYNHGQTLIVLRIVSVTPQAFNIHSIKKQTDMVT